jgi:hypothetical protein
MSALHLPLAYLSLYLSQTRVRRSLESEFTPDCLTLYYYDHHSKAGLPLTLAKSTHLHLYILLYRVFTSKTPLSL